MRVVLDTNVLVSALIAREGPSGCLLAAVKRGDIAMVTSDYQIQELRDVLSRDRVRRYVQPGEATALLYSLDSISSVISDLPDLALSPDPKDNPILATATAGRADLVVSGDKSDMLALRQVEGVPIVTPREALAIVEEGVKK